MNAFFIGTVLAALVTLPIASGELPFIGGVPDQTSAHQQESSPHVAVARELLDILSRTELLLQGCVDADSVRASLPALSEQRKRMHEAVEKQSALPDPGDEDIQAVGELADTFSSLVESIREHVSRLRKADLMNPELEAILQLPHDSPDRGGEHAPDTP